MRDLLEFYIDRRSFRPKGAPEYSLYPQIVKRWMKYEITKQKAELNTVDDENVMRVFEPRTQTVCVEVKEPLIRRFLSPSWNDTSLAFYLWTLLVCIGCLYNLVTIVIMVFEEARRNYYRLWICFNLAFDGVFLIDLLLQTRREATYNQWIFSYDKIPDPILIMCGVDNWTTENDCSTDIVPPLRIFEDHSNMTEEISKAMLYWENRKVDQFLQQKAKDYFIYSWSHGGGQVDEEEIAEFLPPRLYGQLAVHIHMETLRRVKLFEECEPNLLYELILKLELRVYSPMDDICRKGDVGTEMYIVKEGAVEVVSDDGSKVFVRLGEGTVFGELSILNIPGNKNGNRRTANVRSVGYSDLYVLSKTDLWEALREYPEAKSSLMEKAFSILGKSILAKDNMLEESENEMHVDEDLSVAEKLEAVSQSTCELAIQLNEAECRFQVFAERAKQLLFALEKEVDSELDQMHMMK
ncbi:cyclic nucleotide-binding domain protein [Dictyocaulus viviparus]|uniref:Cyclic nucleotide-binding domain protein n=1 Tax=Dictyocaulus viviparus TaxID=29172 RepID=A0A0D8XMV6_DICVI|nr:cyclic nucleotide-binding domain protein [Dictyocaulus viviparus]